MEAYNNIIKSIGKLHHREWKSRVLYYYLLFFTFIS